MSIYEAWHNSNSYKIRLEACDLIERKIKLSSSAAYLNISWDKENIDFPWLVEWTIIFFRDEKASGKIRMSNNELGLAFNVSGCQSHPTKYGDWMIKRYYAEFAEQGKFIRDQDRLNIPGPGTGNDGDPNISILLASEITKAVEALIQIVKADSKNVNRN